MSKKGYEPGSRNVFKDIGVPNAEMGEELKALVVPVDYATYCSAGVAAGAALFLVDHREQFLANRDAGTFDGYPDPAATLGEAIVAGTERPASGRVVVTHLGVGLADLVFASAILDRAAERGLGTVLAT
jgi:ornithine cyclodeaminase/alanine dehydrogenase-like protein (mu-crystallin family)